MRNSHLRLLVTILIAFSTTAASAAEPPSHWVENGRLTTQAQQVLSALRQVESYGLSAGDFEAALTAIASRQPAADGELDELLNATTARLIRQLHDGRVDPHAAGYALNHGRAHLDLAMALRQVASAPDALVTLSTFEPHASQYRALKQALSRYRLIRTDPQSLPALPSRSIKPGDIYAGSAPLRRMLVELGDGPASAETANPQTLYDASLAASVANFQRRHGLEADGKLGARTFASLTVPIAHRIRQIELTMERWRWLPDFTPPAVIVNVPQFVLYTLTGPGEAATASGPSRITVIVGESARQTPIFDSAIESVIIRPYWNVPSSILRDELLPLIVRDSGYLGRHNMEIVRGDGDDAIVLPPDASGIAALRSGRARLRQRPGPDNALGLIKFVLPNPYSVYLHSTPESQLFARDQRALSHGCIRVSDATALAAYLLKETEGNWDVPTIEAATCGAATFAIRLAKPMPIFILYGTVVVDTNGDVLFFDDVYGYDQILERLLRPSH